MSFLDRLLGRKNRTSSWRLDAGQTAAFTVDVANGRFSGATLGDPLEKLAFLGPADNYHQQAQIYDYKRWGFYLVEEEDCLSEVVFLLHGKPRLPAFQGRWLLNGREKTISAQTRAKDIRWELGEPAQAYTEPSGELIWIYRLADVEWEFAWLPDETLESVEMRPVGVTAQ
jgi:hypothetical protein